MRALRGARLGDERGIALVAVIAIGSVIAVLVVSAVALAIGGMTKARNDQDWNAALAAAYAGIEEYQSRLASDSTYLVHGNPAAPFTADSGSAGTVTLPAATNVAFGIGKAGTWGSVDGSSAATFRYEVDNSSYGVNGKIRIRSTGRVGAETRSIVADLKQEGFIDFLYFTDYEIRDPELSGAQASCKKYAWAGRAANCEVINFGKQDVISGPTHSNDTMRICGSTFKDLVTTGFNAKAGAPRYTKVSGCGEPTFALGAPEYSPVVALPPTNSLLKKETRTDLPEVQRPGCLYTGPTEIVFTADGKMSVRSPWTRATRVAGDPATSGSTPAQCGTPGTSSGQLGSTNGATIEVPTNNVIYVQNRPSIVGNPNTPTADMVSNIKCAGESPADQGNGLGFPLKNETNFALNAYSCDKGDVFVKGTFKGSATIASENYVYVTGNLVYEDRSRDILGLVGQNAVWVWNPFGCLVKEGTTNNCRSDGYGMLLKDTNRTIHAAILSVAHTFQVQHYNLGGPRGTLTVRGSIAQKFRGTVATTNGVSIVTGYAKNYEYDARLRYTAPPKFLSPVTITYGVNVWIEVEPAFDSAGSVRP